MQLPHCVSKPVLFVESLSLCVKANVSTVGVRSLAMRCVSKPVFLQWPIAALCVKAGVVRGVACLVYTTLCVKAGVVRGVAFFVCKSQCEHGWCSEPCNALCVKAGVSAMANSCTVCQSRCCSWSRLPCVYHTVCQSRCCSWSRFRCV
jgi:hypothetical protein